MNEKELADKVKTLTKAVQSNEPASTIIMMIEAIKREPAPSEALLRVSARFPRHSSHARMAFQRANAQVTSQRQS